MFAASLFRVYVILGILIGLTQRIFADESEPQDDSKFKYGYVISHKGGSIQAHVESRDGDMALGRYYVNHPNGSGQKVTYFADDLGFHTGVSYTNRLGTGSSKTEIAMGSKAIAALTDFDAAPSGILVASTAIPLHGVKISQKLLEFETGKPAANSFGKLSYPRDSVKGFYLTQDPLTVTTKPPKFVSENPEQVSINLNDKTQSTTQSIQTFLQNNIQNNDEPLVEAVPSFVNQKSIERTHFNNEETHLILEVQKHAEGIIRKDLAKGLPSKFQNDSKSYLSTQKTVATVTMQPIVITDGGTSNVQNIISTTFAPEVKKLVKGLYSESINSLKITEKRNKDQSSEDSAYFKVSLSPSFISSINTSQGSQSLIDIKLENRNLNNSLLCKSNLCELNNNPSFSDSLASIKPKKDIGIGSDITNTGASQKQTQTFYPESQIVAEKHYITTIDVQKGIPIDVRQMEDGSIRLANSFESNKLSSQKQPYNTPTIRPILSNSIFVTPAPQSSIDDVYFTTTNEESATVNINTVTQPPTVIDVTPKHNLYVPPSLNAPVSLYSHYQTLPVQNEIPTNNLKHHIQHFQTVSPEPQYSHAKANSIHDNEKVTQGTEELRELQKNIQELRQKILNDVDAKHEEEKRQEKFNENERREYMENLKKVEELKEQKPIITYNPNVEPAQISLPAQTNSVVPEPAQTSLPPLTNSVLQQPAQITVPAQTNGVVQEGIPINLPPQTNGVVQEVVPINLPVQTNSVVQQLAQISVPAQTNSVVQQQNVSPVIPVINNSAQSKFIPQIQNNAYPNPPGINHFPSIAYSHQQIQNPVIYQQPLVAYTTQGYHTISSKNERKYLETSNVETSYVQRPSPTPQNIQLPEFLQAPPSNFVTQSEIKPQYIQDLNFFNDNSNTLSFNSEPQLLAQETNLQYLNGNSPLGNTVPYDYNSYYDVIEPVSYINNYQVQVPAESQQISVPAVYQFPQPLLAAVEVPQPKLNLGQVITYSENPRITDPPYHVTVSRPETINKLRIQPLKPSPPNESAQAQAALPRFPQPQSLTQAAQAEVAQVQALQAQIAQTRYTQPQIPQNLLPPSQFQQTYFLPSFPSGNRLHLRHIKKNRNLNSDQATSQSQSSVTRKGKSLSNLRIEYGFKPPLRPSVEFTEEVKPSIYGPSTRSE